MDVALICCFSLQHHFDFPASIMGHEGMAFDSFGRCTKIRKTTSRHEVVFIKSRIQYLLNCLETLKLVENRRKYVKMVHHLRGKHGSTAHLAHQLAERPRRQKEAPSFERTVYVGSLMQDNASTPILGLGIIAYLEERPRTSEPSLPSARAMQASRAAEQNLRCLLCSLTLSTHGKLSRHISGVHWFGQPFNCPEKGMSMFEDFSQFSLWSLLQLLAVLELTARRNRILIDVVLVGTEAQSARSKDSPDHAEMITVVPVLIGLNNGVACRNKSWLTRLDGQAID